MANKERRPRKTFTWEGKKYEATGKTQEEAIVNAALMKDKLKRGEIGISENMTVRRWSTQWLETYKKGNVTDKVYQDYERKIKFLTDDIGSLRIRDVSDIHLQKVVNRFSGYSDDYVNSIMQLIKGIFRQARISRVILFDPSESIKKPRTKRGTHRSITSFEREHILKVAETHVAGLWVKTMLYCGLRPGETIPLRWKDIDFKKKRLHITEAKESGSNTIKGPKSKAGVRIIPIPKELFSEFEKQKRGPFDLMFPKQLSDEMHTETSLKCYWKSFKKALDISMGAVYDKVEAKDGRMRMALVLSVVAKDLTPYCLRHTCGTDYELKGVPINIAKVLLGHGDISVTGNIYTHFTEDTLDMVSEIIDGGKDSGTKNLESENNA